MSSSERTKAAPFQELNIIGMDPLPLWDRLGGGWDLFKDWGRAGGTVYKFSNKYPYSSDTRWVVAVNVRSGEIEISGPNWVYSKASVHNIRLYQEKKIEFYSADGKMAISIDPTGVSGSDLHSGTFPIGNHPMGHFSPKR